MVRIEYLAQVDVDKCIGCRACVNVCPTEAIQVVDKKAVVDEKKCLACQNCTGVCQEEAIERVLRSNPLKLGVNYEDVDQDAIRELCLKAHLHPMQWLCLCTATRVREGAAAILMGARTPEEIALMTGVRSGCTAYCFQTMMRLLKAHGVVVTPPEKGYRWYDVTQTLWEVPPGFAERHPGFFLEEDKEVFRKF